MPFDCTPVKSACTHPVQHRPSSREKARRHARGLANYHGGLQAEDAVLDHYERSGFELRARRWRGRAGEIDLIFIKAGGLVFVEVKKGRDFAAAAARLAPQQIARVARAAEEYAGQSAGQALSALRIDAALVDDAGRLDILENITI